MADRFPTYFGASQVGGVADTPAFRGSELVRIRARRRVADVTPREGGWPDARRFDTMRPGLVEAPPDDGHTASVTVVVRDGDETRTLEVRALRPRVVVQDGVVLSRARDDA